MGCEGLVGGGRRGRYGGLGEGSKEALKNTKRPAGKT